MKALQTVTSRARTDVMFQRKKKKFSVISIQGSVIKTYMAFNTEK